MSHYWYENTCHYKEGDSTPFIRSHLKCNRIFTLPTAALKFDYSSKMSNMKDTFSAHNEMETLK